MNAVICPNCGERISIDNGYGEYICPECDEPFDSGMAEEVEDVDEDYLEEAQKPHGSIIGTILFIVIIYLVIKWISGPKWTLFVCQELVNPNYRYECQTNAFIFENSYKSLSECQAEGNSYINGNTFMNSYAGYECGYKCKFDKDFGTWVCARFNQ